jgi:hypothetical protein
LSFAATDRTIPNFYNEESSDEQYNDDDDDDDDSIDEEEAIDKEVEKKEFDVGY